MTKAEQIQKLVQNAVTEDNILPITSRCDASCVFCSHKNNPPEINILSVGVRAFEDVLNDITMLDPSRVVTIGESASSIIEGEPFSHPNFTEILTALRQAMPNTTVSITTNGHYLTEDMVEFLKSIGGVYLSISLNSASIVGRKILMGDSEEIALRTIQGIRLLKKHGISFTSSLVAMPNLTGWDDMRATIEFLAENNASAISVFLPAFGNKAPLDIFPDEDLIFSQLHDFIAELSPELPCPVLLEPSNVRGLNPIVSGVSKDSPAWIAGVRKGDVFISINGHRPRCRVEAFDMLSPAGEMKAELLTHDGNAVSLSWVNAFAGGSGVTMEYDFDMGRAEAIRLVVMSRPGLSLGLTSQFAHEVLCAVFHLFEIGKDKAELVAVKNYTFGGTIKAAGLLTISDYEKAYNKYLENNLPPAQVLVPSESFNSMGYDLTNRHFNEMTQTFGVPVIVV